MAEKKIKALFDEYGNYRTYLQMIIKTGKPYKLIQSNYCLEIESEVINIKFIERELSQKAFIGGAKIKKDIRASNVEYPEIDKNTLEYFDFADVEKLKKTGENIFNIDLKSAYARVLLNHNLITENTFFYLQHIPKEDRLASAGMLASRKDIYYKVGRELIKKETINSNTENYFFMCVKHVAEIMREIKKILAEDFVYSWVDGVFFENKKNEIKIEKYLKSIKHPFTLEEVTNFRYFSDEKNKKIIFSKSGKEKSLNLPNKNSEQINAILRIIDNY